MVPWFCKGDEELKVCGFFGGSATATAVTERLFEALWVNNVEVLLRRLYYWTCPSNFNCWLVDLSNFMGFFYGSMKDLGVELRY